MSKMKEKPLSLPFLGKKPHDYGFKLVCPNCGSDDVTFLFFNKITNNFGIRCWYCETATRLFDRNSWVRDLDDCGMNNFKHVKTGEIRDYYQLEKRHRENE